MSFFSEEQSAELKQLFFEGARELLQTLNEEGLQLEQRPGDAEIIRGVRRTVHTLKGDSAACGYRELSQLAHELEDVLTPEIGHSTNGSLAELVLSAADTFEAMLRAYRESAPLPSGEALRAYIRLITQPVITEHPGASQPAGGPAAGACAWTEYEQMVIREAANNGSRILLVAIGIDENCPLRAAALQLVRNVLEEAGTILALHPEEGEVERVSRIEAALATSFDHEWVVRKCQIPAVVSDIAVRPYEPPAHSAAASAAKPAAQPKAKSKTARAAKSAARPAASSAQNTAGAPKKEEEADVLGLEAPATAPKKLSTSVTSAPSRPAPVQKAGKPAAAPEPAPAPAAGGVEAILRVDADRIDTVLNLVGELIIGKSMLHQTMNEFERRFPKDPLRARFVDAMAFQGRVLSDLQKSVMKIRMVPVEQLFRRFPRIVRDVSKARAREVTLETSGEDTDLDKSILDILAEPLTHLIRNAVDHGIESPAERAAAGKPEQGLIQLKAYHQGNQVVIEVRDDGRGIDSARVVAKAVERGIISREQARQLAPADALNLIFHSGLSTAEEVTSISGRGIGMDVVKTVLEGLKGSVHIETQAGVGTSFYLRVPLTLAIIQALLFGVGDKVYAVPLASVAEITRAQEGEFHRVDDREVLRLRDKILTLVRLEKLEGRAAGSATRRAFIIVIAMGEHRFGLVVDRLVGEEELVIKALDDQLVATELVSGASILGDGTVVLILNIPAVVAKLGRSSAQLPRPQGAIA